MWIVTSLATARMRGVHAEGAVRLKIPVCDTKGSEWHSLFRGTGWLALRGRLPTRVSVWQFGAVGVSRVVCESVFCCHFRQEAENGALCSWREVAWR